MEVLALIPARGGSGGLPGKNLVRLAGKPLIQYTVEAALVAGSVTRVAVSTDDETIASVARKMGVDVIDRPARYATADADVFEAERHAIEALGMEDYSPDVLVRLQPTSPLRTGGDVDWAVQMVGNLPHAYGAVVSIAPVRDHSYLTVESDDNGRVAIDPRYRAPRQEYPSEYRVNGAIYAAGLEYWWDNEGFFGPNTYGLMMPRERSVDIDDTVDLRLAEALV